jgi:hypothetical protein
VDRLFGGIVSSKDVWGFQMTDLDRASLLTRLARAVADDSPDRPLEVRLCRAFLSVLGGDGAALTLSYTRPERVTLCVTDDVAARLEDLQDVLGEGPGPTAYETQDITVADLGAGQDRWPLFVDAAREIAGAEVLYAVPMRAAAAVISVLSVHQSSRVLPDRERAQFLADAIGAALVKDTPQEPDLTGGPWSSRSAIHQATGMVAVQLRISPDDALALLRAHAFSHDTTLADVASQIISRRLSFSDDAENEDS